jgi:hypothetical protein
MHISGFRNLVRVLPFLLACALPVAAGSQTGLWIGDIVVERVNRPGPGSAAWNTTTNLPAANTFSFRALIHVDASGQARLLQRVLLAYSSNGLQQTNPITHQVTTNGSYRLLTDESRVAAVRQTDPQARITRLSSVGLPFLPPQFLNGQFGPGNTLVSSVTIPYTDPNNPFVHAYAPLHDNWLIQNSTRSRQPEGVESFTITRSFSFTFASQDPSNASNPKWGIDENGGEFKETVEGLYRPIQVQGRFRLQRLTSIGQLD